jgi:probable rRNA maturation factor
MRKCFCASGGILYLQPVNKPDRIQFFKEDVSFRLLRQKHLKAWIIQAFRENKLAAGQVSYIFCSDRYLLKMNQKFLEHDYYTDIITFDNSTVKGMIDADIFISSDRVAANAKKYNTGFSDELHRVMIHGALHLMGYNDKNPRDEKIMRQAEEYWLKKRRF